MEPTVSPDVAAPHAVASTDGFAAAYAGLFVPLMRVAFLLTGSNAVAEDVVHDVFVRCRDRIAHLEHPPSYLRAAVVNACRTHHHRAKRHEPLAGEEAADLPLDLIELRDAMAHLSPRRRAAVVLRYHCDLEYDEIAAVLGCRPATARSLVHRGVTDLREELR
jgi:RNA polymerase sigma factor (sigma-70 family)